MNAFDDICNKIGYRDNEVEANLESLKVIQDKSIWVFTFLFTKVYPVNETSLFINNLKKHVSSFKSVNSCKVIIKYRDNSMDNKVVQDYYRYTVDHLERTTGRVSSLKSYTTTYKINQVYINCPKDDSNFVCDCLEYVKNDFKHYGISVAFNVNCEDSTSTLDKVNLENLKEVQSFSKVVHDKKEKKRLKTGIIKGVDYQISSLPISEEKGREFGSKAICLKGYLFNGSYRDFSKRDTGVVNAILTDFNDSISISKFFNFNFDNVQKEKFKEIMLNDGYVKLSGSLKYSTYEKDNTIDVHEIERIDKPTSELKYLDHERIELALHTKMTTLDGITDIQDYVKEAKKRKVKAIACTDINTVQAFPSFEKACKANKIKPLYGVQISSIFDSDVWITKNTSLVENTAIRDLEYTVFDIETTGLSVRRDDIIEVAAIRVKNGMTLNSYSEFVKLDRPLSNFTKRLTHIKDSDLVNAKSEYQVMQEFRDFSKGSVLVAHNASFDTDFIKEKLLKYDLFTNDYPILDTLTLARVLYFDDPKIKLYNLKALSKFLGVNQSNHHRAIFDTEATVGVFNKLLQEVKKREVIYFKDLNKLILADKKHLYNIPYYVDILVRNVEAKKRMYKLLSLGNTTKFYRTTRVMTSDIDKYREGLLVGSASSMGMVFETALNKSFEDLREKVRYFDYIEIQPPSVYSYYIETSEGAISLEDIHNVILDIIKAARLENKIIVATSDAFHLKRDQKEYRKIYLRTPRVGGGRHRLANVKDLPSMHYFTASEMYEEFSFIDDKKLLDDMIINNPEKISSMIEEFPLFPNKLFKITDDFLKDFGYPSCSKAMQDMVWQNAKSIYGEKLPTLVYNRLNSELNAILKQGFSNLYFISHLLVKNSNKAGYIVGSRGSVGSSFVATMMKITEVNPLAPHYVCPKCKRSIFKGQSDEEVDPNFLPFKKIVNKVESGYDLPSANCPYCGVPLHRDGHDTPFEVFLGFKGDKVPDIDLNFSGEYQARAHEDLRTIFGYDRAFRAGTISTIQANKAYGFVKGYYQDLGITKRNAEIQRIVNEITDVRQSTGQHPGGVVVVPNYIEIYDVTPIQYPADDTTASWRTTHFDYHSFESNLFKVDVLGHDDPTLIAALMKYVKENPDDFPFDNVYDIPIVDEKVMKIFQGTEVLGVTSEQIMSNVGTYAVPEMGTSFVRQMLEETKPTTFSQLVKISGLSHGTNVWLNNAKDLVAGTTEFGKIDFKDVIGCRDDIMVYLMYKGVEPAKAFKIMETVRKGRTLSDEQLSTMRENNVPEWYIYSCKQIQYMFPKAHAIAYVMNALRIAWFKVHRPIYFYSVFFGKRASYHDVYTMKEGYQAIRNKIEDIERKNNRNEASNTEQKLLGVLLVALEMTARGYEFRNIDIAYSKATEYRISKDKKALYLPFAALDGLGESVAKKIVSARNIKEFTSIKDFKDRTGLSNTLINKMLDLGVLDGYKEDDEPKQASIFEVM